MTFHPAERYGDDVAAVAFEPRAVATPALRATAAG